LKTLSRILPKPAVMFLLQNLEHRDTDLGSRARRRLGRLRRRASVQAFERHVARLKQGDTCMDCGANVGVVTKQLAATGATVHAYEPDPDTFRQLRENVDHLPNVSLHQVALGSKPGHATLRRVHEALGTPQQRSQASSIYFSDPEQFVEDGVKVEQRAFAEEVARLGGNVALVKMDIEGAEFDILPQIFADPARQGFDALFVETHERMTPSQIPVVAQMRRDAAKLSKPFISLDWP